MDKKITRSRLNKESPSCIRPRYSACRRRLNPAVNRKKSNIIYRVARSGASKTGFSRGSEK